MSVALEAFQLSRSLPSSAGAATLVRDVSFSVRAGEFVAISGASGCGKSSLLYLLGLLDSPNAGEVFLNGHPTSHLSQAARTRARLEDIGFVFQFHFLLADLDVAENVALPMRRLGRLTPDGIAARVDSLLTSLGVGGFARVKPGKLSGGQRQRVAIARALANDPALLLCDEPTGNLDLANSESVTTILADAARRHGKTVVCVTHDAHVAARADRVLHMQDGRLLERRPELTHRMDRRPNASLQHDR